MLYRSTAMVTQEPSSESRAYFDDREARLINKYSMENRSNTPDNILAEYLVSCLDVFNRTVAQRETWYGRKVF